MSRPKECNLYEKKCDRCKKIFDSFAAYIFMVEDTEDIYHNYDLCPECHKKFKNFMDSTLNEVK
jgi:hypothetical protein